VTWAVARGLLMEIAFMMAITRQRQSLALIRMSERLESGVPLVRSPASDDELRLLCLKVPQPSQSMSTI
jgi:hypothetical protein